MAINKQENLSDNKIAKELLKTFEDIAQKVVDRESQSFLKQSPAKVIGYEKKDDIVYVTFIDDANANCYTYRNCTGASLNVDDIVNIIYTKNRAKGTLINKLGENDLSDDCIGRRGEGEGSVVIGDEKAGNQATKKYSWAGGYYNSANGDYSFVGGGRGNVAQNHCSTVVGGEGNNCASFFGFIGAGYGNKTSGDYTAICGGSGNEIHNGTYSFIGGGNGDYIYGSNNAILSGSSNRMEKAFCSSILGGVAHTITHTDSTGSTVCATILGGEGCSVNRYAQIAGGTYNAEFGDNDRFIIGNGTGRSYKSNAFRINSFGDVYAGNSLNGTGADFAEMREWSDGNPNSEDRRGLFVVYDDNIQYGIGDYAKIRIANENDLLDDVIGIVSSTPTVVGNTASEIWQGMYQKDIFGSILTHEVIVPAKTVEEKDDETGEITTKVIIEEHTEIQPIINPNYDSNEKYISREHRKEWAKVGMLGMIVTVDDGTCQMLKYCKVGENGNATYSDEKTKFKVVARLDDTHIAVEIK